MHVRYMTTASRTPSNKRQDQLIRYKFARCQAHRYRYDWNPHTRMGLASNLKFAATPCVLCENDPQIYFLSVLLQNAQCQKECSLLSYFDNNPKQHKIFSFILVNSSKFTLMHRGNASLSRSEKKSNRYIIVNPIVILRYPIVPMWLFRQRKSLVDSREPRKLKCLSDLVYIV